MQVLAALLVARGFVHIGVRSRTFLAAALTILYCAPLVLPRTFEVDEPPGALRPLACLAYPCLSAPGDPSRPAHVVPGFPGRVSWEGYEVFLRLFAQRYAAYGEDDVTIVDFGEGEDPRGAIGGLGAGGLECEMRSLPMYAMVRSRPKEAWRTSIFNSNRIVTLPPSRAPIDYVLLNPFGSSMVIAIVPEEAALHDQPGIVALMAIVDRLRDSYLLDFEYRFRPTENLPVCIMVFLNKPPQRLRLPVRYNASIP